MKHINMLLTICAIVLINTSCATLNRAHGELNYNNHISKGQELQDLKNALDAGAINQDEYNLMKEKIINDKYIKDLIEKFDDEDEDGHNRKASFNIEL
ncbi:MAG: hypothetical protein CMG39_05320 [Candidatus Marinimicrobia bacterium]|nr:hypothetical protein [Candidatus Neomarinimicrobiota bacterium]|tara:strand:+ start:76 stop:369 length:294 start_codon:yes stop_codon:yes gene_type:complete